MHAQAVVRDRLDLAKHGEGPGDFTHQQGWVLIAFQNAFHHLASDTPIEDALIETVGEGGDTDTNEAIFGALLGASQGCTAIPARWTTVVLACRSLKEAGAQQPRPARYWPDDVPLLAEALLMLGEVVVNVVGRRPIQGGRADWRRRVSIASAIS